MYFPFSKPQTGGKRSAAQPQTIYSEFPEKRKRPEAVASGRAIEAVSSRWTEPCTPKQVFEQFRAGRVQSVELVEKSAKAIANLVADLTIGLDTQKVVIGGSVGLAEGYLPLVQKYLSEMPHFYHCELEAAKYGGDAGLIGAAAWAEQHF